MYIYRKHNNFLIENSPPASFLLSLSCLALYKIPCMIIYTTRKCLKQIFYGILFSILFVKFTNSILNKYLLNNYYIKIYINEYKCLYSISQNF